MKTFNDLTEKQQKKAVDKALAELLEGILNGSIRFNDELNEDGLQAAIDAAREQAGPWFNHRQLLMEARYKPMKGHVTEFDGLWPVRETLEGMARCDAEDAGYAEPGEQVVHGIVDGNGKEG